MSSVEGFFLILRIHKIGTREVDNSYINLGELHIIVGLLKISSNCNIYLKQRSSTVRSKSIIMVREIIAHLHFRRLAVEELEDDVLFQ